MRKTLLTLFAALLAAGSASAQKDFAQNGNFESWTEGLPTAWEQTGITNVTVSEVAEGRSGKAVAVPVSIYNNNPANARLGQKFTLAPGTYTLTFYAKASALPAKAVPGYTGEKDGKADTRSIKYGTTVELSDTEWKAVSQEITVETDGVYYMIVRNDKTSAGAIYVDDFSLVGVEGGTVTPEPQPEQPTGSVIYEKALTDNAEGWTLEQGKLPEGLSYVWAQDSRYGLKATAYNSSTKTRYATEEAWAISPEIKLTDKNVLIFEHAQKFAADPTQELTLWMREGVNGTERQQLIIPVYPDGQSWNFVSSGAIDLSAYAGKTVQFGFKYTSTESVAATWEIKNFKIVSSPTSVSNLTLDQRAERMYDLSGRRVSADTKGIVIVDGKKLLVR